MISQTYQELFEEVKNELPFVTNKDIQEYFWRLKQIEPERFERMMFDTNGHKPYSKDLSDILMDINISTPPPQ